MRLVQVLSILLTQLCVGTLIMTSLLPPREIRLSFFTFNSLLSALAASAALVLSRMVLQAEWEEIRFLGLTVIGATTAYGCFRLERPDFGRFLLIISGLLGLFFGLLPFVERNLAIRELRTTAPGFFDASMLAGALLLGVTNVGMILGHWYLLMRRLSFEYLERFAKILLGAVALRAVLLIFTIATLDKYDPAMAEAFLPTLWSTDGDLLFFVIRIVCGLVLPLIFGIMTLRCVMEKANQAATGMLYVVEISVLFGELFAGYLLI